MTLVGSLNINGGVATMDGSLQLWKVELLVKSFTVAWQAWSTIERKSMSCLDGFTFLYNQHLMPIEVNHHKFLNYIFCCWDKYIWTIITNYGVLKK